MASNHLIELDASPWNREADFYEDLLAALGAPDWHGKNLNAMVDSLVVHDTFKELEPFKITIISLSKLPESLRERIIEIISKIEHERDQSWVPLRPRFEFQIDS